MKKILKLLVGVRRSVVSTASQDAELCFQDMAKHVTGHVALDQCVGHLYFGFGSRGWNPFTQAVKGYLKYGNWHSLERYYQQFQPETLAEAYFLRNHPRWAVLNEHSPFLRLKPWRATEVMMSGHLTSGNQNFGPVTPSKLRTEIQKYENILSSIQKNGFKPEKYGTIRGYFLIDHAGRYVFRITQGMHRTPVLDALGWKMIPVSFDPLMPRYVSLNTICYWPKVVEGTFSVDLATYMFNRHFWDRGNVKSRVFGDTV